LSESFIFLSFGTREGFNNPPLEAANAGCYVIGYHGYGGVDYWNDENFITINEGDIVDFQNQIRVITSIFGVINASIFKNSFTIENSIRSIVDAFKSIIIDDILCKKYVSRQKLKLQKNYFLYKTSHLYTKIKKLLQLVRGN
jgi:glycosyltransferase involved in cell wall biosynthesis